MLHKRQNSKEGKLLVVKATEKAPVKKTRRRAKVTPKYQNPARKSETWSGRGRKPAWVQAILDQGGKLDDIAIR